MSVHVRMPALSPTMEEGSLSKWIVKVGDTVSVGDVLAEIETDKATMEVETVDEGIVAQILVDEGSVGVKVNTVIAILAEEGEDPLSVIIDPTVKMPILDVDKDETMISDSQMQVKSEQRLGDSDFRLVSPLARRLAKKSGINLHNVIGSGPRGRIIKSDVDHALREKESVPSPLPLVTSLPHLKEDNISERRTHDNMRKTIAQRLTESSISIPFYSIMVECRLDHLLTLRKELNIASPIGDDHQPLYKISINDFVIKALATALTKVPLANVSWTETERIFHKHVDVGVAVSVEDGLFTPTIRQADIKTLSVISGEVKDMATRARNRQLRPEEYSGGCTAVSNLGMFGVREFTSIINPPQASILSIGASEKRPFVQDNKLAIGTMMSVNFSFDHRAIDGMLGGELVSCFKHYIERPEMMLI
ncbi:dihydrolipoamide acetyltransferase family protein [Candidatus Endowatersipora endosymbiont of Watersipora subatra]|uniref:dihydrolipoamide acetyltransferase family protein n=1 Tax=Candidatus Endowatersipora endosymbiont of Watersipora subatra TaxID=3077946 RepID=UPI00312C96EE